MVTVDLGLTDIDTTGSDYGDIVNAVTVAVAADPDVTFDPVSGTLTYTAPSDGASMTDIVIDLPIVTDGLTEGNEDFSIDLTNPGSSTGAPVGVDPLAASTTTTIIDADGANWSISGPVSVDEGANAQYTVALGGTFGAGTVISVDLGLTDIGTDGADYGDLVAAINAAVAGDPTLTFNITSGTLTYTSPADGSALTDIMIDLPIINDSLIEGPENFSLNLTNALSSGTAVGIINPTVTTTVNDTQGPGGGVDGPGVWDISGPAAGDEGSDVLYTVSLSGTYGAGEAVSVELGLSDGDTNSADYADFTAAVTLAASADPSVTFDPATGVLTYTSPVDGASMNDLVIDLTLTDDIYIEGPEDFTVGLANPDSTTGAAIDIGNDRVTTTVNDTQGSGGVADGPAAWQVSGPANIDEGGSAQYTVGLTGTFGAGEVVTVEIGLADIDTTSSDYGDLLAAISAAVSPDPDVTFDAATGVLTYTAPSDGAMMADIVVDLPITDDTNVEGPESYTLALNNAATSTGAAVTVNPLSAAVITTINDTRGVGGSPDQALWSIVGDTTVDEGGAATYTVSLNGTLESGRTATVELTLADIDTNSADYGTFVTAVSDALALRTDLAFDATTGILTYTGDGNPMTDLVIRFDANDDSVVEGPERYQVLLSNASSTNGASTAIDAGLDQVTTTINDTIGVGGATEEAVWSFGADQTVLEGANSAYVLALAGVLQAGEEVSVELSLTNLDADVGDYDDFATAVSTAAAAYTGPGTLTFDAGTGIVTFVSDGNAMTDLPINLGTIDDPVAEGAEDFQIQITNAASATGAVVSINAAADDAVTTIDDTTGPGIDEVIWSVTGDATVDEGGSATYRIALAGTLANGQAAAVELSIGDLETDSADYSAFVAAVQDVVAARPELEFDATTGILTFTGTGAAMTDLVITLDAVDDSLIEGPERYSVQLTASVTPAEVAVGVSSTENIVLTTINDTVGDAGPGESAVWSITGDASVNEGDPVGYTISLGGVLQNAEVASIDLALTDIETSSADYDVLATAINNAVIAYTGPGMLAFDGLTGTLTFVSDGNPMDNLNISLGTVNDVFAEGNERLTVALSNPASTTGIVVETAANSSVTTTIVDDDVAQWSISGSVVGDEGSSVQYTVALSNTYGAGETVSVQIDLTDIATNRNDYGDILDALRTATAANPDVVFDAGTGTLTYTSPADGSAMTALLIDLPLTDDAYVEGDETFTIGLTNPTTSSGAVIDVDATAASVTTLINDTQGDAGPDDGPGQWSITGPVTADEGGLALYTVTLSELYGAGEVVSVQLDIANIDTDGSDYGDFATAVTAAAAVNPDVTFDAATMTLIYTSPADGASMTPLMIEVPVTDDVLAEGPESYTVNLTAPTSLTGARVILSTMDSATTTINDTQGVAGAPDALDWSITGSTDVAEGGNAIYTISLDGTAQPGEMVSVDIGLNDLTTSPTDYGSFVTAIEDALLGRADLAFNPVTGTLTYTGDGAPMANIQFTIPALLDGAVETPEDYSVQLTNPTSATGVTTSIAPSSAQVTTTIESRDTNTGNSPPVATDDAATTQVDMPVGGDLLTNDGDPDGDMISINTVAVTPPTNGLVTINPDGSYIYIPDSGFSGIDSFVYEINDSFGNTDTATVTIDVRPDNGPVNDPPAANDDAGIGQKNAPISGDLLANDSDPEGDPLTVNTTPVVGPASGSVVINPDGTYMYFPNNDFVGNDRFTYEVCDSSGACDLAIVYLTVFDNPPVAGDDFNNTNIDTPVTGNVLTNDSDPNPNDDLTVNVTPVLGPVSGNVALNPDGSYTYTPNTGFTGTDTFAYEVSDEGGNTTTATVTIEVRDTTPNNSPVANDDSGSTFTDQPVSGSLTSNDSDPDGDPLTINTIPVAGPVNGVVVINPDGTYTYSPNLGFNGTDSFTYEVTDPSGATDTAVATITVMPDTTPGNDPPIANDDSGSALPNQPVTGNLLANDSDPNGDPLVITLTPVTPPTSGTVAINPDGSYSYTPNPGFVGTDTFTYEVCDDQGACTTATVRITIADTPPPNSPPIANPDSTSTLQNVPVTGNLITNDGDPDGDVITVNTTPVMVPANGSVVIHPDGTFTYTPDASFLGTDSFVYEISDSGGVTDTATVTVEVRPDTTGPANDSPFAGDDAGIGQKNVPVTGNLLSNDSDPNGDPLTINPTPLTPPVNGTVMINPDGSYTYTPNDDFVGTDSFVYEVCDDQGACDQATVVITVFDSTPVATDDFGNTIINTSVTGNVLSNDINNDARDDLRVNPTPVSTPTSGTVTLNPDGTFTYLPNVGFVGTDTFEYEVCDEGGNCDIGRVTIEVRDATAGNNPPIANNDSATVFQGGTVSSSLISNDGDPDGDAITVNTTPVSPPANGTLVINPDGTYTYTPAATFTGTDSFVYEIVDSAGVADTAIVTIQVRPDTTGPGNDPPIATADSVIGQKNIPSTGDLLANDSDPNGDPITINTTPVTPPSNGTLMINPDGTFTYVPNNGFAGTDSFEYEICDDSGACGTAIAVVTIFNEPPVGVDDQVTVIGDAASGQVTTNDTDSSGDPLTARLITPPNHGTIIFAPDGTFTYTPGPTYTGNDTFTYEVCDDSGACGSATVTLFSPFAFDSFTNQSIDVHAFEREMGQGRGYRSELLSERLSDLATEPILAGYATPGATLVGRLYDKHGALVGETTTRVNQAGNWVMHFFDCEARTDYRVVIEHVATEQVEVGNIHFRLTPDTYRSLQLGAHHTQAFNIGQVMSDAPSTALETWHHQNVNPLKLE